ncbi:hypothetical protein D9757_006426 [Collybiopsis confluens]|uniref:F-box domain-containing protein n=1 Tax=Collybiopsis confluens TaxID=2823264 RepID=A0A8H5M7X6_9AGAR|nr:hypothetical protein D9757_006426 [Collybiopsis confluens]
MGALDSRLWMTLFLCGRFDRSFLVWTTRMRLPRARHRMLLTSPPTLTGLDNMVLDDSADADIVRDLHKWTISAAPNQSTGDKRLENFPTEIYLEILSNVSGKEAFNKLALVCRLFCSVITPKRFNKIIVYLHSDRSSMRNRSSKLYEAIHSHDPLAIAFCGHVRECAVKGTYPSKEQDNSLRSLVEDLLRMHNLRLLTLDNVYLSRDTLCQLSRLSSIRTLILSDCEVGRELSLDDIKAAAACLYLDSFSMSLSPLYEVSRFARPTSSYLVPFVTNSHTTTLSIDSDEFVHHLAHQQVVPPLQKLKLYRVDVFKLFEALCRGFTTLVDLDLCDPAWPDDPGAQNVAGLSRSKTDVRERSEIVLPLSDLPHLRRLTCPPSFAYLFSGPHALEEISFSSTLMTNRESRNLIFDGHLRLSEGMRLFSDSPSENLRRLVGMSWGFLGRRPASSWTEKLKNRFPQLRYLEFIVHLSYPPAPPGVLSDKKPEFEDFKDQLRKILISFVNTWAPVKSIQEIVFDIDISPDISTDKDWFREYALELDIKNVFPNMHWIIVGDMKYSGVDDGCR